LNIEIKKQHPTLRKTTRVFLMRRLITILGGINAMVDGAVENLSDSYKNLTQASL
jgi:hypothetical protein